MSQLCKDRHCFVPHTACNLGHENWRECPNFGQSDNGKVESDSADGRSEGVLFPWSGNALGSADIAFVAGRSLPFIVGVLGLHNAGKTTLLSSLYLSLLSGHHIPGWRFTSSFTLGGWENIAHPLRWPKPTFPLHTERTASRLPGLLHLGLRAQNESVTDLLLTDAPGEWFNRWAINRDGNESEGARWISMHASGVLLLLDSDALSGRDRGEARTRTKALIQRLSSELRGRPVAVIWSKSDLVLPDKMRASLNQEIERLLPSAENFSATVRLPRGRKGITQLTEITAWLLERSLHRFPEFLDSREAIDISSTLVSGDPFLRFGHR